MRKLPADEMERSEETTSANTWLFVNEYEEKETSDCGNLIWNFLLLVLLVVNVWVDDDLLYFVL